MVAMCDGMCRSSSTGKLFSMTAFYSYHARVSDVRNVQFENRIHYSPPGYRSSFARLNGLKSGLLGAMAISEGCAALLCRLSVKPRLLPGAYSFFPADFDISSKVFERRKCCLIKFGIPLKILAIPQGKLQMQRVVVKDSLGDISVTVQHKKPALRIGALIEFEQGNGNLILAVVEQPYGKRIWTALDQHQNSYTVRETQVSYIIPGVENFNAVNLSRFLEKATKLQDPLLLEPAWEELFATGITSMDAKVLAKVLFGATTPEECYASHRLLSSNQIFFRCNQRGKTPIYAPRPLSQVNELRERQALDQVARCQLDIYVNAIRTAMSKPLELKPTESCWHAEDYFSKWTCALKAFALDSSSDNEQEKLALQVLETLGMSKTPSSALDILISIGIFPKHVNLELLRSQIRIAFSNDLLAAANSIRSEPFPDMDLDSRDDLTSLIVYTIDSDDTEEIDDGLSAMLLPDGRIKVWIHVADPTRWIKLEHSLEKEARQRGTSVYLPTQTIPMFPMELARDCLSLREGHDCAAITISVILEKDGSLQESSIRCSIIRPTHRLSYDDAHHMILRKDEIDLNLLSDAAAMRHNWRESRGAAEPPPLTNVKVSDADSTDPCIKVEVFDPSNLAVQLVSEMMILCGEAVAMFGEQHQLMLPYRGQIPQGWAGSAVVGAGREMRLRRTSRPVGFNFNRPVAHASLGLSGYVQFTSPIRRYTDMIAHYQVKAALRGDKPVFGPGYLEEVVRLVSVRSQEAKRLEGVCDRYWIIEYLRRQQKDTAFNGIILGFARDRDASVLLKEVGIEALVTINSKASVGDLVKVIVKVAHPRKDLLLLKEVT